MFVQSNKSSADRFIPRRAGENFEISNFLLQSSSKSLECNLMESIGPKFMNFANVNYRKDQYIDSLLSTVIPKTKKILNFSEPQRKPTKHFERGLISNQVWPVRARKFPSISAPIMVLDMPGVKENLYHPIADWGKSGFLASIFEEGIYIFHPETKISYMLSDTEIPVDNCIKWNPEGNTFAISMRPKSISVWDFENEKPATKIMACLCINCTITCIEWSIDGKYILTGCSNGRLMMWSSELQYIQDFYPAHTGKIITILFSTFGRYFLTSGFEGLVRIWLWPIQEYFEINCLLPVRAAAWHPWRDSIFALGTVDRVMTVWNVSSLKRVDTYTSPHLVLCDALAWNNITGELVASYLKADGGQIVCVLSSLNTIVDAIEWHNNRVLYLMWSPDSTQLATCSTDECLYVWNFLGKNKNKKETKTYKSKRQENFGICIR